MSSPGPKAHHPSSDSTAMTLSPSKDPIARIPLDLRQHTPRIALQASTILFTSGILPLTGYLALYVHFGAVPPHTTSLEQC